MTVVEAIVFGDVDNDGVETASESFDVSISPGRHLFQLPHQPIERIESVSVDGLALDPDEFTFDAVHGWVSVGPEASTSVVVDYVYSFSLDMAATNWDTDESNFLFYHRDTTCTLAGAPQPEPVLTAKNRYISLVPGNAGRLTALRVTLEDMPAPFESHESCQVWVGEPFDVTETSGDPGSTPEPTFKGAELQSTAYCADWGEVGLVRVLDDEIVPNALYHVSAIDCNCDTSDEANYSTPLPVTTSLWGDLVGDCGVSPCTPPDGTVNFVDITAVVDKFKNTPGAPIKARVDLAPDVPDRIIDFSDIPLAVDAFRGLPYPFDGPDDCP
jgi:hypothetical protein